MSPDYGTPSAAETTDTAVTASRGKKSRGRPKKEIATATFGPVKLADLMLPRVTGKFRWSKELGWLRYDGSKWSDDGEATILNEAVDTLREHTRKVLEKRNGVLTADDCRELAGLSSGSVQSHAIKILRGLAGVLTDWRDFDPLPGPGRPWLVPCSNGRTVELHADGSKLVRDSSPDDMATKTVCAYDPTAEAPRIMAAFENYQPAPEVRSFMLRQWARGLSGMGTETFTVNLGERGGNGKGTMQTVMCAVAGDYAVELPVEVILKGRYVARETYRSELALCRGARLIFTDEPEVGSAYNLGMLKKITGGGKIQGRGMGKEAVEFEAHVLFQMAANTRPMWAADGAMDRRYIEIAWDYEIGKDKIREDFKTSLLAEASGFLNVILRHWTGSGPLEIPDVVKRQTEIGAQESSPASMFRSEALVQCEDAVTSAREMYDAYSEWARQNGIRNPVSSTKLGRELVKLGLEKAKQGTVRYLGIKINDEYRR